MSNPRSIKTDRAEALRRARAALAGRLSGAMCQDLVISQIADAIENAAEGGRWYGESTEREACAVIAEGCEEDNRGEVSALIAAQIRARSSENANTLPTSKG